MARDLRLQMRMTDQRRPGEPPDDPAEPIDEAAFGGSSAESGGVYDADGPTVANVTGDTMGTADEAKPGEEPDSDPYSG
jgi:hypothetical protein